MLKLLAKHPNASTCYKLVTSLDKDAQMGMEVCELSIVGVELTRGVGYLLTFGRTFKHAKRVRSVRYRG